MAQTLEAARGFLAFVNQSPTPFHAVLNASLRLERAGFKRIREADDWESGLREGKYYFTRNQTSLLAFVVPKNWKQGTGLSIVATHVDSPNLRIRPVSNKSKDGYLQLGVETYGGGIWHSWFDRDLSIAGRIIVSSPNSTKFESKLVKLDKPLLRIPTLAIHLDRSVNDSGFKFNLETELLPIIGQTAPTGKQSSDESTKTPSISNHHPTLLEAVSKELKVNSSEIRDFELHLYDTQPACLGGLNDEFIFSPRLDNLFSSYCTIEALAGSEVQDGGNVNVAALFNHEEIGSVSTTGAESSLLPSLINRLSPDPATNARSIAKSLLLSADMAHAVHPNYASKHQEEHKPRMNNGVVIKTNAKQRYASDATGSFLVKRLAELRGGKCQEFEVRNDCLCGSTVGPMLSKLGVRTVDIGVAQLSMHSIREICGSHDAQAYLDLFGAFYESFAAVDAQLAVD